MPGVVEAGLWGLLGGSAQLIGAMAAYLVDLPQRLVAAVMAIGVGVLISAVAFELMDEAYARGGFDSTAIGFLGGAAVYTGANILVSRSGGGHRKRSGSNPRQSQASASDTSGLAIAVGALLDGIPESVVIGVSLLHGTGVSLVTVAAVFLSNVPEGLSSVAGMKRAGRTAAYIFGVWGGTRSVRSYRRAKLPRRVAVVMRPAQKRYSSAYLAWLHSHQPLRLEPFSKSAAASGPSAAIRARTASASTRRSFAKRLSAAYPVSPRSAFAIRHRNSGCRPIGRSEAS